MGIHTQKNEVGPLPHTCTKNNSEWITGPDVRAENCKTLRRKNIGINLHDFGLGTDLWEVTSKVHVATENKKDILDFIRMKDFRAPKGTITKVRRQPTEMVNISTNHPCGVSLRSGCTFPWWLMILRTFSCAYLAICVCSLEKYLFRFFAL